MLCASGHHSLYLIKEDAGHMSVQWRPERKVNVDGHPTGVRRRARLEVPCEVEVVEEGAVRGLGLYPGGVRQVYLGRVPMAQPSTLSRLTVPQLHRYPKVKWVG